MKKILSKKDILYGFVIGEACAVIFLLIKDFLGLPPAFDVVTATFPVVLPALSIGGLFFTALLGKKWPTFFQAGKNILVGVLNSFIDIGILNLLMFATGKTKGTIILLFKAFSFTGGALNSYFWNKFWTFKNKQKVKSKEFVKFYGVAAIGLVIHEIIIYGTVNLMEPQFGISPTLWANVGNMAAIFVGFFWNFIGYKFWVFKK